MCKFGLVIPKVVAVAYRNGRLRELFITNFKSQFKRVFTKLVVTRADRLREWSRGELRPLNNCTMSSFYYNCQNAYFVVFLCELRLLVFKTQRD